MSLIILIINNVILTPRFYVAYEHQHTSLLQPVSCNPLNPEHHTKTKINMSLYANLHKYANKI